MDDFDHDRVKRDTVDMEFISDISDRLSAFTSSVKWDQGQAAFPPIPRAKDHVFEIDNGSNASATSVAAFLSRLFFVLLIQSAVFIHILRS
jgi:hypothetical protein